MSWATISKISILFGAVGGGSALSKGLCFGNRLGEKVIIVAVVVQVVFVRVLLGNPFVEGEHL